LETTSVHKTTLAVQRIESPRRKEPPEETKSNKYKIICKKQSKK
jgi:hypothetical protein